jgi:CBS-domain-containing membrane protein
MANRGFRFAQTPAIALCLRYVCRWYVRVDRTCTVSKAVRLLQSRKLRCLPVVDDDNTLLGIIGRREVPSHYLQTVWNVPAAADREACFKSV